MGILRIEIDCLPQTVLSQTLLLHAHTPHVRQGLHHAVPGFNVLRGLALNARCLGDYDLRTDQIDDPVGDLVLQFEDIREVAVVTVEPTG